MLSVCILWHMHQPYYVDPTTQTAVMPWVRLHAVKGYWDMVRLIEEFPEVRVSFNLTPVLVKQIRELVDGVVRDEWLEWSRTPASELSPDQRVHLLEHFFKINWDNLIRPHSRYWQLLMKRGTDLGRVDLRKAVTQWNEAELRDLQVWFNLAWCGYKAVADFPELGELKRKGQGFSEEDKQTVLRIHAEILAQVLGKYRALAGQGKIELTTTPFFHPIMPLLYDTDFAKRCMPNTPLPPRFSYPEDVRAQLHHAVEQHENVFGIRPRGLWPSEGAVCPELVPLIKEAGFDWFGTDEEILFRSLADEGISLPKGKERECLYRGYSVEHDGAAINAAFRDRTLSDFIGFSASRNNPELAVEFLMGHLRRITEVADPQDGLVPIILDGENAWEYFPDGGERFLHTFYNVLRSQSNLAPVSFGEYFQNHKPDATIRKLHTGSWIRADFDIWIGEAEENRAWELLGQTRRHLEERGSEVEPAKREKAKWELYAAEGSDWFWWYGPDFHTDSDVLFDHLFRRHLESAYRSLGSRPPEVLKARIRQLGVKLRVTMPTALIQPTLDGRVTSFFEWHNAGRYEIGKGQSTMFHGDRVLANLYFGFDLENLYLRADFQPKCDRAGVHLRIHIMEPRYRQLEVLSLAEPQFTLTRTDASSGEAIEKESFQSISTKDILELKVPFSALGVQGGERIGFCVEESRGEVELGRHPENGLIRVELPRADFELENWCV